MIIFGGRFSKFLKNAFSKEDLNYWGTKRNEMVPNGRKLIDVRGLVGRELSHIFYFFLVGVGGI